MEIGGYIVVIVYFFGMSIFVIVIFVIYVILSFIGWNRVSG